jgi:hypothetical protein
MPIAHKFKNESTSYTYADYLAWETDERYELLDGAAYLMASPTVQHQAIIWNSLKYHEYRSMWKRAPVHGFTGNCYWRPLVKSG